MWLKGKTIDDAIVIGEQEGGLYKLKGHPEQSLIHDTVEPIELWHRRLAHVHYIALPIVRKAVEGLPEFQAKHDGVCKGCARGKNTKKTFPSSESNPRLATSPTKDVCHKKDYSLIYLLRSFDSQRYSLEIIHSDVCDPMSSNSLSGYAYYVSFIDDFSRKTWIYFMKNKDEVFSKFKEFKALIKNHTKKEDQDHLIR